MRLRISSFFSLSSLLFSSLFLPAGAGSLHCFSLFFYTTQVDVLARAHTQLSLLGLHVPFSLTPPHNFINCRVPTTTTRLLAGIKSRGTAAKWRRLRGIRQHGTSTMGWHRPLAASPRIHSTRNGRCSTTRMMMLAHTQLAETLSADGKLARRTEEYS